MDSPRPIADNIQKYINDALGTVPADKRGAIVGYVDDDGDYKGVVAVRVNNHWSVAAHVDKPSGERPAFGAAVMFSWG